jgi:hypothetical protein
LTIRFEVLRDKEIRFKQTTVKLDCSPIFMAIGEMVLDHQSFNPIAR